MTQATARALSVQPVRKPQVQTTAPQRRTRRRRRIDPIVWVSIVALLVLITALGHVAQRAHLATLTYELHKEQLRLAQAERVRTHLLVEIEKARAFNGIEADARSRLGFVEPQSVAWLTLEQSDESPPQTPPGVAEESRGLVDLFSDWFDRVRLELAAAR